MQSIKAREIPELFFVVLYVDYISMPVGVVFESGVFIILRNRQFAFFVILSLRKESIAKKALRGRGFDSPAPRSKTVMCCNQD